MIDIDKIYNEDCEVGMQRIHDGCIDLIVTSPPYDNLRKYGGISDGWDFDKFMTIARQVKRVLKEGGVCVWVVGDSTVDGSETGSSFRQALYFTEIGMKLHDTMIYRKANPIPQNHRRYEQCFEYMFVFSNGKPSVFNGITVPTKNAGKQMEWGGRKNKMDDRQCRRDRESEVITTKDFKLHDNIFEYPVGGGKTGHPAVFPYELSRDHILSWSNEGDAVLDPFIGSGTTAIACIREKRHFLGFELNKEYFDKANERIREELDTLEQSCNLETASF